MTIPTITDISEIPDKIPSGTKFEKLENGGEPYVCYKWEHGKYRNEKVFCLYYQFPSRDGQRMNRKRVPLKEIKEAVRFLNKHQFFDRSAFNNHCPISKGDGPCGYAVIGRILEKVFNAEYRESDGFHLVA